MLSIVSVINSFSDSKRLRMSIFLDISLLLCFYIKPYDKNVSDTRTITVEGYKELRKRALKNGLIHSSKVYISSNYREGNLKAKGRPSLKCLDMNQMAYMLVSQVCREEQVTGKKKRHLKRRKHIFKYPNNISADD